MPGSPSSLGGRPHTPEGGPWSSRRSRNTRGPSAARVSPSDSETQTQEDSLLVPGMQTPPPRTALLHQPGRLTSTCPPFPAKSLFPGLPRPPPQPVLLPEHPPRPRAHPAGQELIPGSSAHWHDRCGPALAAPVLLQLVTVSPAAGSDRREHSCARFSNHAGRRSGSGALPAHRPPGTLMLALLTCLLLTCLKVQGPP